MSTNLLKRLRETHDVLDDDDQEYYSDGEAESLAGDRPPSYNTGGNRLLSVREQRQDFSDPATLPIRMRILPNQNNDLTPPAEPSTYEMDELGKMDEVSASGIRSNEPWSENTYIPAMSLLSEEHRQPEICLKKGARRMIIVGMSLAWFCVCR